MLRGTGLALLAALAACAAPRPRHDGSRGMGRPLTAVVVPLLEPPQPVDASGTRVVVGALRAEKSARGWSVADDAPSSWIVAAAPDDDGWLFVSWFGEVLASATFTGPLHTVSTIPAFVERQPSAGRLTVLGDDLRLYAANGAGAMPPLEGLGERAIVAAVFDRPEHGLALDLGGELLESRDAGRTWARFAAPRGTSARQVLARAAQAVPAIATNLSAGDAQEILAAVLARTGPQRAYGDGFAEVLSGGHHVLRLADGSLLLVDADGTVSPLRPPCEEVSREGPTLVARCDGGAQVLDLSGRRWTALAPGQEPHIAPSGRTLVTGSGCGPRDPLEVIELATGHRRTLGSTCIRLEGVTDTMGWGRADGDSTIRRLDLTTGSQSRIRSSAGAVRGEATFNGDGTLAIWPRVADTGTANVRVTLLDTDGRLATSSMPPAITSVDFDGELGLAAGDPHAAAERSVPALWATADRGRSWRPVPLPIGAILQYPHCFDGTCFAGNVRISSRELPATTVRPSALSVAVPPMPALRCTTEPGTEPTPDTQVVEAPNATVSFRVGRDERVTVRWRLATTERSAEVVAEGRIAGLAADEDGAYRFVVGAVTRDTVFFSAVTAGRDPLVFMARKNRGLAPGPRGLSRMTPFGVDLPDGGFAEVVGGGLRIVDRDGRGRSSPTLHGVEASGWAMVDGLVGPAFVVGLTPAFPIYVQLPGGTRRLVVNDTPIRGCSPGATGNRVGLLDSETRIPGAHGALMTELIVSADGTACIARMSNPGAAEGVARLVAHGPDRFEGVMLQDGALSAARCAP